jgi:hypothetical protein
VNAGERVEEEAKTLFADAGMALYRAQLLEKRVVECVYLEKTVGLPGEERKRIREELHALSFGLVIKEFKKTFPKDGALAALLTERREDRDRLAHRFFYTNAEAMVTSEGRVRMSRELKALSQQFLDANKTVRKRMSEWGEAHGLKAADAELIARELRMLHGLPPDLPPHLEG